MVARIRPRTLGHLYIEEWMKALGLTDEKLAERLKTNRVTVWRWRSQQKRLNPEKIAAIAQGIGIEPELLWHLPGRPSLDAIVKDAPDDLVQKAAAVVKILIKTGT